MRQALVLSALFLLASPVRGFAQAAESVPDTTRTATDTGFDEAALARAQQARERFVEGMEHYRARRFREAIRAFELAAGLVPSADLWFNIARSHEQLGEWSQAADHFRRYLRDRVDPPDRGEIEDHIRSLDERVEADRVARNQAPTTGSLRIEAEPAGAAVTVDNAAAGHAPIVEPLTLSAGRHAIASTGPLRIPAHAEVSLDAGTSTTAYLDAGELTAYRAVRGERVWTWVLTGVAGAGLATSLGLGIHAKLLLDDDNREGARTWATYSDVALVSSVVVAVGAVVLYFVEGRSLRTERIQAPSAQSQAFSEFAF